MLKRLFDICFSLFCLLLIGWLIVLCWLFITVTTGENGLFFQIRIGQHGKPFAIIKLKTMLNGKITKTGAFFRTSKMDELPQFVNVLKGDMSIVGPRPDIPGYYDLLEGENRKILELKPGLTSEASLKYFNEEYLLLQQEDPLWYNDTIIFPDKVRMNLDYYYRRTFFEDLKIILKTVFQKFR